MGQVRLGRQRPDRRAIDLEYRLLQDSSASSSGLRSNQDPASSQGRLRNGLDVDSRIVIGRIVDAIAYTHFYKVQCERGLGTLRCCDSAATSLGVVGARQLNTYSPGTQVVVLYHPQATYAIILAAVPDWSFDARQALPDFIVQGSNVGLQADGVHHNPFSMADNGGIIDFSAGRPSDSIHAGEYGAITETGLRIFLDSFMAQVAVDEETGLFVFYADQLTRLAGRNLQIRSTGSDREDVDDESEFSSTEGWTPYPWEANGLPNPFGVVASELSADSTQRASSDRSRFEPVFDDQLGIYRERRFHGYLGQGGLRKLCVPIGEGVHRYSVNGDLIGLAEEAWGLDGSINLRSSRSVFIAKHPLIPEPKATKRPEASTGDTNPAYASCGLFGDTEHLVAGDPTTQDPDAHLCEPAAVLDLLAYNFNWKGLHPFHYHTLDWYLPEESDCPNFNVVNASRPSFVALQTQQYMNLPGSYTVQVDDRYGLVKYYANLSFIALLPTGGIVLRDGFGAEIRMAGGTITTSAPGDIIQAAGKSIINWAGWDAILKANNCVDISANWRDVRIKAEDKVMVTGGNNGCGGVLIESRADHLGFEYGADNTIAGIVLRAVRSGVVALAQEHHLIQYTPEEDRETRTVIDGGTSGSINIQGRDFTRQLTTCAIDKIGNCVNEYWEGGVFLATQLVVNGSGFFNDCLAATGSVVSSGAISGRDFTYLSVEQEAALEESTIITLNRDSLLVDFLNDLNDSVNWLRTGTDLLDVEFYFRTELQYLTAGSWGIYEPAWHQMARDTGGAPAVWIENTIVDEYAIERASWPGLENLQANTYGIQDLTLASAATGSAVDRGSVYEAAYLAAPNWVELDTNWAVVAHPPEYGP